jgi:hypothetical protein
LSLALASGELAKSPRVISLPANGQVKIQIYFEYDDR